MPEKKAHLEMIQGVVNRLSQNSFLLKGWSVVLVAAVISIAIKEKSTVLLVISFFPVVIFWGLDGYFLRQERLFRKLYDHVRTLQNDQIDYSMDISQFFNRVSPWLAVSVSKTLSAFHGSIVILIAFLVLHDICGG
jgi:hypothetical protein